MSAPVTPGGAYGPAAPSRATGDAGRPPSRAGRAYLVVGGVIVAVMVAMALLSYVWTPFDPTRVVASDRLQGPSAEHWLGTDKFGRDTFSQVLVGARTTLYVGFVAVGVAALLGVPLGILSAMGPRWLDGLIMRAADIGLAFPGLLLAIMFAAVFGASTTSAMVAIGLASVPSFARVTRAGALGILPREFITAARVAGRRPASIGWRHVLPNVVGLVIVQASVSFALAILAEAGLSFLGFGTPPPTPSWGRMLQESQSLLASDPRLAIVPGVAIALAVLGFNLLGDGLRDRFDPQMQVVDQ
ncbi:ABC transporter permease [Kytococcus schroeteri]|uniref:ABC transporter permease n=1 Tax=Kytococcus schroeteri TaxID=138300 RepID=UPI0035EAF7E3